MVCNGLKAVEMVRKRWEDDQQQFSVIFMDCNMPKMDGYQATENIRKFVESQPEYEQP
jgi:CheY-like chemotaxis protein